MRLADLKWLDRPTPFTRFPVGTDLVASDIPIRTISAGDGWAQTALISDIIIKSANTGTLTLPAGSAMQLSQSIIVKVTAAGKTITVSRAGSDLIDSGTTTLVDDPQEAKTITWIGTNWSVT